MEDLQLNTKNMTTLEQKEKRWRFLNDLHNRGVESVKHQLERNADEIMLIKIELELERRRSERDSKIKHLIND